MRRHEPASAAGRDAPGPCPPAPRTRDRSAATWVAVRLPTLPVDVFARGWDDRQARALVVTTGGHYPRVVACNGVADAHGIRPGQLVSAALALAPAMVMRERDADAEAQALATVAQALLAFTPGVALAPADAVLAEVAGSARLFGGLDALVTQLEATVMQAGFAPVLGIAPTPEAALLLARAGRAPVAALPALHRALANLPLPLLGLSPQAEELLRAAGVDTFAALAALPRAGLARRCGRDTVAWLDRVLGRAPDARTPYVPPPSFEARLPLPALVEDAQALGFALQRLVQQLSSWLTGRGLGVTRLALTLVHERHMRARGTPATVVPFALGAPARDPTHLRTVLRERLARVVLPAPVEALVLASQETAPLAGRNLGLLPGDDAHDVAVPLFERLRARLGDDAVTRLAPLADHRPEAAQREAALAAGRSMTASPPGDRSSSHAARDTSLPPRPLWLLDEAQPLGEMLERKPWILRDGPERIESGWWDGRDFRRDYFVAEMPDGGLAWIYRDHRYGTDDGEWFLHGIYA